MKILIDNGHGSNTPGKCSPDKKFREYAYARKVARAVKQELDSRGYDTQLLVPEDIDISLYERCSRVNKICDRYGKDKVLVVSVHVNAAASDWQWHNATGWEAYTTSGQTKSDQLATCLYEAAKRCLPGKKIRTDMTDGDPDKEANFYILRKTKCAAVLTENFFQDTKSDVAFLESKEGFDAIVQLHVQGIVNYIKKYCI